MPLRNGVDGDPAEIVPNLFLGSIVAAEAHVLLDRGVVAVVNASNKDYSHTQGITRMDVAIPDSPDVDIQSHLQSCCDFIKSHLDSGALSRVCTVVITQ